VKTGVACLLALSACGKSNPTPPPPAAAVSVHRFAVGVQPTHCISGLGEAPHCCYDFIPNDVLQASDAAGPRLIKPGTFTGTCGGRTPTHLAFEAARVASVKIALVASHKGLTGDTPLDRADFVLDSAHPEWTLSLAARPIDEQGKALETGADTGLRGLARWSLGTGCDRVLTPQAYEGKGEGFERPADDVKLAAKAPGTCELEARYGEARAKVTVRVR
jgi:hypothetical protein